MQREVWAKASVFGKFQHFISLQNVYILLVLSYSVKQRCTLTAILREGGSKLPRRVLTRGVLQISRLRSSTGYAVWAEPLQAPGLVGYQRVSRHSRWNCVPECAAYIDAGTQTHAHTPYEDMP